MMYLSNNITSLLVLVSLLFLWPSDALAYLDLGTGSYMVQLLLASLLGGLFALKLKWQKIKTWARHLLSKDPE